MSSRKDAKALSKCHKVVHITQSHLCCMKHNKFKSLFPDVSTTVIGLLIQCFEFNSMIQLVEIQPVSYTKLYMVLEDFQYSAHIK